MGGMIATKLAALAPYRVSSLTLMSVTGGGTEVLPRTWKGWKYVLKVGDSGGCVGPVHAKLKSQQLGWPHRSVLVGRVGVVVAWTAESWDVDPVRVDRLKGLSGQASQLSGCRC
jgi:pimeloyl-ACP methyl ester carboxylesterase